MGRAIENREKNQQNRKLVLWKDQQNWQTFSYIEKKKNIRLTKIRKESRDITTDVMEGKKRIYYDQVFASKLDNPYEWISRNTQYTKS